MTQRYFTTPLQISAEAWQRLELQPLLELPAGIAPDFPCQLVAHQLRRHAVQPTASGGQLQLLALLNESLRWLLHNLPVTRPDPGSGVTTAFLDLFPPDERLRDTSAPAEQPDRLAAAYQPQIIDEMLILATQNHNPATLPYRSLFHDHTLQQRCRYLDRLRELDRPQRIDHTGRRHRTTLLELLAEPMRAAPDSLVGQLEFLGRQWATLLPGQLLEQMLVARAAAQRELVRPPGGPGPAQPQPIGQPGSEGEPAPEAFSLDAGWMEHVVMLAKSTLVWLDQLSRRYRQPIQRLDQIPESELSALADSGINTLWLIGLWERSSASQRLKQLRGNPEAMASAYALYDYQIADELGGEAAFANLKQRCREHGIRLAGDVVPNHTGLYSRWVKDHPDWYVQLPHPPYPGYRFSGPDLSPDPELGLFIEDGYYDNSDAAVVFKHIDRRTGRERFIYHGNDGTHMPWNDTAQLDYLQAEVREAMIRTIIAVARRFPVIRFDAAMTLAKKHFQRLWYPPPGEANCVPSRHAAGLDKATFDKLFPIEFWREVVDRIAVEVPDTLLLAEAFWLMEGYFVRSLGMHRVYNSAFMNMLKREDNTAFRMLLQETLAFNPEILKRYVNFMNNPDEATAVEQFGKGDKYFGVAVLLATLPGLPMFGHGQLEGLVEKYGMEYRRAYHDEGIDAGFLEHHHRQIFPLLRNRRLYSGIEYFQLFDVHSGSSINQHLYAYVNGDQEQRSLVLYHNHPGEASGRLRLSVPKRQHGETRPAIQTSLVRALGLPDESRMLVRYRNHRNGLWHLASLHEWSGDGLQIRLGAYEYAIFGEFSPVPETPDWQRLQHKLGGRGVTDLELERRKLQALSLPPRTAPRLKILLVASEVAPLAKTGGLADVAGALPQSLRQLGHEVRILLPHYPRSIPRGTRPRSTGISFQLRSGETTSAWRILQTRVGQVTTWLLDQPEFFDRDQLYGTPSGDYPDNGERFGFFCRAVLQALPLLAFQPDVIHVNDWQTGLIPLLLKTTRADDPFYAETGSLLTIHNLGYQGLFPLDLLQRLDLPESFARPEYLEYWGRLSFLKGGVEFADRVNTVSPTYAQEILTPEFGVGFDGILQDRGEAFGGILNGIDCDSWNPATDPALPSRYQASNLRGKSRCKNALQRELGLARQSDALLIAMVTRLDAQKGIELLEQSWDELLQRPVQFVLLGSGRQDYMDRFAARAEVDPERVAVILGFDDRLARRIYAGSDLFLMPSLYEPCGLGQLIALRYGCVPLVRHTGGLADTISDIDRDPHGGNGFSFTEPSSRALLASIDRACSRFTDRSKWLALCRRGMQDDFSWQRSAEDYVSLYRKCRSH